MFLPAVSLEARLRLAQCSKVLRRCGSIPAKEEGQDGRKTQRRSLADSDQQPIDIIVPCLPQWPTWLLQEAHMQRREATGPPSLLPLQLNSEVDCLWMWRFRFTIAAHSRS